MPKIVWNVPIRMTVTFIRQVALPPEESTEDNAISAANEDLGWEDSNFQDANLFFDSSVSPILDPNCKEEIGRYTQDNKAVIPTLAGDEHDFSEEELLLNGEELEKEEEWPSDEADAPRLEQNK